MEHLIPRERNFLGWIKPALAVTNSASNSGLVSDSYDDELLPTSEQSPRNPLPRGTILRLDDVVLRQLLNGKEE